jgi:hypothetical protein
MTRKKGFTSALVLGLLLALAAGMSQAQEPQGDMAPQDAASTLLGMSLGTAFTYQGRLTDGGSPANGDYDFEFRLYDADSGDGQVGSTVTVGDVTVSDGLFTVELDFGGSRFTGDARWLRIGVRAGSSSGAYTTLTPRQPLTPAPYALALPGLWTKQSTTSPSIIGGYSGNSVSGTGGVKGGTISGGGYDGFINHVTDDYGTVGGGANNRAGDDAGTASDAHYATVGGGYGNQAQDSYATIGGGRNNEANGVDATVGGGQGNISEGAAAAIGGGVGNDATASYATIGGGWGNEAGGAHATVGGGGYNTASGRSAVIAGGGGLDFITPVTNTASGDWSAIGGGAYNATAGSYATVGGGYGNEASGYGATIGGGGGMVELETYTNTASGILSTIGGGGGHVADGDWATIGGGAYNTADGQKATVGGGSSNVASNYHATVPGGYAAAATLYGQMAYASGRFSEAGDAQASLYILRNDTSDDTETELFLDGVTRRLTIAPDRAMVFDIQIIAHDNWGNSAGYSIEGVIENFWDATSLVGSVTKTVLGEDDADWDVTVEADDTNDALVIKVTGGKSQFVNWVAVVRTAEVGK